jgi:hypothetical protein
MEGIGRARLLNASPQFGEGLRWFHRFLLQTDLKIKRSENIGGGIKPDCTFENISKNSLKTYRIVVKAKLLGYDVVNSIRG